MTHEEKLRKAKKILGTNWCLHKKSTYNAQRRNQRDAVTLRPVVIKAIKENRL